MLRQNLPPGGNERLKRTIDMVTRLYVHVLRSDEEISQAEISILYSLLTNLFSQLDVSWESYLNRITNSKYEIDEVLKHLDTHLSLLDKIRLIQSLIIMAKTEEDFAISEITEIMDIAKKLSLTPESFLPLIDYFENNSSEPVSIPCPHHIIHIRDSVISDYAVFGNGNQSDIRFRNPELLNYEAAVFAIDKQFYISVGNQSNLLIDGKPPRFNSITLLSEDSKLQIGGKQFCYNCLQKIYNDRTVDDVIAFRKSTYDFVIHKEKHWYSVQISGGILALNGRELPHGRRIELYYDDLLQIKGYAPFDLSMVIEARSSIGVEDFVPSKLYILMDKEYFSLSRSEKDNWIAMIERKGSEYYINPPRKGFKLFLNGQQILESLPIVLNTDIITIQKRNFRINNFFDLIESPFEIEKLVVRDLKHFFPDGAIALDSVSFEAEKGQLIAIMGQSGCGKSTLTKVLAAEITPTYGQVFIDNKNLFANAEYYHEFMAYVPQGDLLYPNLCVYENLYYRLKLRNPLTPETTLRQKVQNIMQQVNLSHHQDTIVGEQRSKNLSGGERKRLNIALELLFEPTLFICDEPTSGLSFNDAEQIIDILHSIKQQGKIVIITIHQPNSSIFRTFDRVLMMDMGGRLAYYGAPQAAFEYFDEELEQLSTKKTEIQRKRQLFTSDYFYDLITYPEFNEHEQPIYHQVQKTVQIKRKFPPEYWRDKFKRKMLYEMIQSEDNVPAQAVQDLQKRKKPRGRRRSRAMLFAFISRSFKMKMRNRTNNFITFFEAPLLGLIISYILRHTSSGSYSFHDNNNIFIYLFVSIIAFIFMGMSNSIEEILGERKILVRERLMNFRQSYYLFSKLVTLSIFGILQATLYHIVAAWVLKIEGMALCSIIYFFLAALTGISIGLFCSSLIKENRAIINLLPLILIPQIIFGGAVIEFERMNRKLILYEKHPIPEVVQMIPSRWLFEGISTAYAKNSPFHRALAKVEKKELTYFGHYKNAVLSAAEFQKKREEIYHQKSLIAEKWDPSRCLNSYLYSAVGIMDGRVLNEGKNDFLSSYKLIGKKRFRSWNFNIAVILLFTFGLNVITAVMLKYYLKE